MSVESEKPVLTSWKAFLESVAPGEERFVEQPIEHIEEPGTRNMYRPALPELELCCLSDKCKGEIRFFTGGTSERMVFDFKFRDVFIEYTCKNCNEYIKTYALILIHDIVKKVYRSTKYGEIPQFGDPTPNKTLRMIEPDKEIFFKGRRCENQGLGIGAYSYYRRVVENQKNRIIDEIMKVVKKVAPHDIDLIKDLELAKKENQFSKAIEDIKHALPASLMIDGENPLTLLHGVLSLGVHDLNDEDCLQYATSIRTVLNELSSRVSETLKESQDLEEALNILRRVREKKKR